jgi:hypothetical protein
MRPGEAAGHVARSALTVQMAARESAAAVRQRQPGLSGTWPGPATASRSTRSGQASWSRMGRDGGSEDPRHHLAPPEAVSPLKAFSTAARRRLSGTTGLYPPHDGDEPAAGLPGLPEAQGAQPHDLRIGPAPVAAGPAEPRVDGLGRPEGPRPARRVQAQEGLRASHDVTHDVLGPAGPGRRPGVHLPGIPFSRGNGRSGQCHSHC